MASGIFMPWLLLGDYNEILSIEEKVEGVLIDVRHCSRFERWMQACDLIDLGCSRSKFTQRGQEMSGFGKVFENKGFGNM